MFVRTFANISIKVSIIAMGVVLVIGVACKGLGYPTPQPPASDQVLNFIAPQTVLTRKV